MAITGKSCNEPVAKILIGEDGQVLGIEDARTGKIVDLDQAPRLAEKPLAIESMRGLSTIDVIVGKVQGQTGIVFHVPPCIYVVF